LVLWGLILAGLVYGGLLYYRQTITGKPQIDGILGVLLGLYTCSIPAANALDKLLYGRYAPAEDTSRTAVIFWWGLNGLALLAGLLVMVVSLIRYTATG